MSVTATPGPGGRPGPGVPRFVVLEHDWPHLHLDLLLERDGILRAWRLPPAFTGSEPVEAVRNDDHRLLYLDYEGPVSGDRGSVRRWDGGGLRWLPTSPGRLRFRLTGERLSATFELVWRDGDRWQLVPASHRSADDDVSAADLDPTVPDFDRLE